MRFQLSSPFLFVSLLYVSGALAFAFVPTHHSRSMILKRGDAAVSHRDVRGSTHSVCGLAMQSSTTGNFFSKFARTILEKAKADVERTKRLFQGLELVRSDMSVIDELLSFWNLDEADTTLEKLEEALITRDFGVSTASRICDALREDIKSGIIRDPR